jgi:hypothetical protein
VIGARIASGIVASGVAVLVIGAVAFVPLPTLGPEPRSVTVEPAPADQLRVCPGGAMRVGDETGSDADTAFAIGAPSLDGEVQNGALERSRLTSADPTAAASAAPEALGVAAADGAQVAGAQSQDVDAPDFRGFAAAVCGEPNGSIWLVGGAMTIGRSTVLLLANPTDVPSRVSLEIFGEEGPVSAPGLSGIDVPAGGQRVLSLAGFAPGVAAPVVHVTARGGRVVADLQQSIVRGLDAVGVETVGAGADPGLSLVIPGVRIVDTVGTNRARALADWQDAGPVVRVAVPGAAAGTATVRVVPEAGAAEGAEGTSFEIELDAGTVTDIPLDVSGEDPSAEAAEDHDHGLQDGIYTVYVDAEVPVAAAVRTSTAVDTGQDPAPDAVLAAPPSDFAWFSAAPALDDTVFFVVPPGPAPLVSIVNPTAADVSLDLTTVRGGGIQAVAIPAGGTVSLPVVPGAYLLSGAAGLAVGVTFAAPGALAALVLAPARPVAGALVVHPD